jgi:hypothetical protein
MTTAEIIRKTQAELDAEERQILIEIQKLRILQRRSFWSRIAALLPFAITINRKTK